MRATKRSMGTIRSNEGPRQSTSSVPIEDARAEYAPSPTNREQLADAVSRALIENGISPSAPDGMHAWRCKYPEVYGACDCFAETVADVVDAVMLEAS